MHVLLDASDRHIFCVRRVTVFLYWQKFPFRGVAAAFSAACPEREFFVGRFLHFIFLLLHQRLKFLHISGSIAFKDG